MTLRMPVQVDPTKQWLLDGPGRRCCPLADTGWELFHRLTLDEAEHYFAVRAGQGFDAIQCVLLSEFEGLTEPAMNGERPLIDNDPTRPNERYFAHCDAMIRKMNARGLMAVLVPAWGDKVSPMWAGGPVLFKPDSARMYGRFLGERYRADGVLWMIGGDRPVRDPYELQVWREMALGIKDADQAHLMTFHPTGAQSSSEYVHAESWLDLNAMQTGHTGFDVHIEAMVARDLARLPRKPTWNSEPLYEAHPVMRNDVGWRPQGGYFDERHVRNAAYRSLLSGTCAHTYGCQAVWQMYDPGRARMNAPVNHPAAPWTESLDLAGARQLVHAKRLMESQQDWLPFDYGRGAEHLPALASAASGRRVMYVIAGLPQAYRRVHIEAFTAGASEAAWFDPRTGGTVPFGSGKLPEESLDWVVEARA
jgi:hypothetical protein